MPSPDVRSEPFDENIGTVIGTSAFTVGTYSINPGQSSTFPRLSKIAALYERYRFKKLEFYFLHDVSQYASQGQSGLVVMSTLFDAASSPPTTKVQMEATNPRVICMPNQNSKLIVPVSHLHPRGLPLFVRPGQLPGGTDIKTYDAGNLYIAAQGMVGTGEVGELHVRGVVEFENFLLDASLVSAPINNQVVIYQSTVGEVLNASGATYRLLLAGTRIGNLGATNTNGVIVFPPGNYLIDVAGSVLFSVAGQNFYMFLVVNGSNVGPPGPYNETETDTIIAATSTQSWFLASDGTSASGIAILLEGVYTTGNVTGWGMLRAVAV
jgi:hypothetical protein